ncbi:MAG: hypothetical protein N4A31_02660 [Rickettsiales bacterium]|jgi:hypothetical protein|nr:hypothetical protein [Rickettsiales bacterium]
MSHPKYEKQKREKAAEQKKLQDEEQRKLQEAEQRKKKDLQDVEHQQKLKDVEHQKSQQDLEHKQKLLEVEQQKKQLDLDYNQKLQEATKQQASQSLDYDKISNMVAKKLEGKAAQSPQATAADIDYEKLSDMVAKKVEGKGAQGPMDYNKLAEVISQNTKNSQVETASIDYAKLAGMISKNQEKTTFNQGINTEVKDKCKLYMNEVEDSLKGIELLSYKNDKKTEEIKETAKLLYTLYQQLYNMQDSYFTFDGSIEAYDYKAEVIKKSNNKLYTLLSKTVNDLSTVNVKNADVADDISNAIREVKQLAPKELSDVFNQMYVFIKDHSEMSDIFKGYCSACGSEENLGGNDQLMLFPFCSAHIMVGVEAIAAESEF